MRSVAHPIAIALGLIAFLLLGYAWYNERQNNVSLQSTVDFQSREIDLLADEQYFQENAFYFYLMSDDGEQMIRQIAEAQTLGQRQTLASNLRIELSNFFVTYGAAEEIVVRLDVLVAAQGVDERANIVTDLINKIADMAPIGGIPVESIVSIDQGFAFISTLVAVLGSVGSAIVSAFLFLTGGGQRRIEHDMLAIDLEKQKVELAQMQYEAREAIAATKSIHERSET